MKKILIGFVGVLIVGVILGYGASWFFQKNQQQTEEVRVIIADEPVRREIQLYFAAPTADFLVPEAYEVIVCDNDAECIRNLLMGLIAGPVSDNIAVLPKETKVLEVELDNDLVRVDFSRHLVDFHPGGSLAELLSIYSMANSLNENFPYIRQLQILVEGKVLQTLKGHVRIDQPIYADFSFSQPPFVPAVETQPVAEGDEGLTIEELIQAGGDSQQE